MGSKAEKAARDYAARYQDHSIDSLVYVLRLPATTLCEVVFLDACRWLLEEARRMSRPIEVHTTHPTYVIVSNAKTVHLSDLEALFDEKGDE